MSAIDTTRVWDTLMVGPLQVEHLLVADLAVHALGVA